MSHHSRGVMYLFLQCYFSPPYPHCMILSMFCAGRRLTKAQQIMRLGALSLRIMMPAKCELESIWCMFNPSCPQLQGCSIPYDEPPASEFRPFFCSLLAGLPIVVPSSCSTTFPLYSSG